LKRAQQEEIEAIEGEGERPYSWAAGAGFAI
jgi:hypothetical protein